MAANLKFVNESLRDESKKWVQFADKMKPVAASADDLWLDVMAFWIGEPGRVDAMILQSAYDDFQKFMAAALKAAVVEFGQIAGALNRIVTAYEKNDQVIELDLNQIYGARTGP